LPNRPLVFLLGSFSACALAILCIGCWQRTASSHDVARVASPNGTLEAVLTETNGGVTTSFGYEVSVGSKGGRPGDRVATLYGAVRNSQAYGANLNWVDDHVLCIQYLRAKSVHNVVKAVNVNGQHVDVELWSGIEDPKAPSGGMRYNLQKQSR
jgi:hypothetical protein